MSAAGSQSQKNGWYIGLIPILFKLNVIIKKWLAMQDLDRTTDTLSVQIPQSHNTNPQKEIINRKGKTVEDEKETNSLGANCQISYCK